MIPVPLLAVESESKSQTPAVVVGVVVFLVMCLMIVFVMRRGLRRSFDVDEKVDTNSAFQPPVYGKPEYFSGGGFDKVLSRWGIEASSTMANPTRQLISQRKDTSFENPAYDAPLTVPVRPLTQASSSRSKGQPNRVPFTVNATYQVSSAGGGEMPSGDSHKGSSAHFYPGMN